MRVGRLVSWAVLVALLGVGACGGGGWFREYEYDEETFVNLDGSARIVVSSSLPALRALHGFDVPTDPAAPIDREAIGKLFESAVTRDVYVSRPWRRYGRAYVRVELQTPNIERLSDAAPFRWSRYGLTRRGAEHVYRQRVGAPIAKPSGAGSWTGDELVAFRLHLPSKVLFHNSPTREVERGNIVTWEQPLAARFAGDPVDIEIRLHPQTILYRTLIIFGVALATAVALMVWLVWWMRRKGQRLREAARGEVGRGLPGLSEVEGSPAGRSSAVERGGPKGPPYRDADNATGPRA
ncbi:MAG: hypothetical protein GEV06_01560 [Luteitalea sp.]|nr:hypothetical protein [Luteitalea sp.]